MNAVSKLIPVTKMLPAPTQMATLHVNVRQAMMEMGTLAQVGIFYILYHFISLYILLLTLS